jgi:hypothetical protein
MLCGGFSGRLAIRGSFSEEAPVPGAAVSAFPCHPSAMALVDFSLPFSNCESQENLVANTSILRLAERFCVRLKPKILELLGYLELDSR